jgi:dTDP-4-amino-4,6-dideoxy-D-galactose acyltransferase
MPNCRRLEWDSNFFGFGVARLEPDGLDEATLGDALASCDAEGIRCTYLRVPGADARITSLAEAAGFHLRDIRVTLDCRLDQPPGEPGRHIRDLAESDVDELGRIGAESYMDSRFYADPGFSRERCDEMYRIWTVNSCRGAADKVIVAHLNGKPAGYITCHLDPGAGRIGLVAVDATARGMGLGKRLVAAAQRWFGDQGLGCASVVTQGRNVAAMRTYERLGFTTASVDLWYHRWFQAR